MREIIRTQLTVGSGIGDFYVAAATVDTLRPGSLYTIHRGFSAGACG